MNKNDKKRSPSAVNLSLNHSFSIGTDNDDRWHVVAKLKYLSFDKTEIERELC